MISIEQLKIVCLEHALRTHAHSGGTAAQQGGSAIDADAVLVTAEKYFDFVAAEPDNPHRGKVITVPAGAMETLDRARRKASGE